MLKKKNSLNVFFKSFLFRYLFKDVKYLLFLIFRVINLNTNSILFLPKKVKKFSVVRSPTMSKLSKEQFEFRFYKACINFNLFNALEVYFFNSFFMDLDFKYSYFKYKFTITY